MLTRTIISVFAISFATLAFAESNNPAEKNSSAKHSAEPHKHAGKHGGLRADSGHHHVELVAKDGSIEFYVEDEEGAPENVKDAKGSATLLVDGKKIDIQLAPADDGSALKGTGDFKAVKGSVAVITLTMPGHKPEQSRFKLN